MLAKLARDVLSRRATRTFKTAPSWGTRGRKPRRRGFTLGALGAGGIPRAESLITQLFVPAFVVRYDAGLANTRDNSVLIGASVSIALNRGHNIG
jgi:hypothetical protein